MVLHELVLPTVQSNSQELLLRRGRALFSEALCGLFLSSEGSLFPNSLSVDRPFFQSLLMLTLGEASLETSIL